MRGPYCPAAEPAAGLDVSDDSMCAAPPREFILLRDARDVRSPEAHLPTAPVKPSPSEAMGGRWQPEGLTDEGTAKDGPAGPWHGISRD